LGHRRECQRRRKERSRLISLETQFPHVRLVKMNACLSFEPLVAKPRIELLQFELFATTGMSKRETWDKLGAFDTILL
jgi:hypothetical protein